jgi:hypothetical protein
VTGSGESTVSILVYCLHPRLLLVAPRPRLVLVAGVGTRRLALEDENTRSLLQQHLSLALEQHLSPQQVLRRRGPCRFCVCPQGRRQCALLSARPDKCALLSVSPIVRVPYCQRVLTTSQTYKTKNALRFHVRRVFVSIGSLWNNNLLYTGLVKNGGSVCTCASVCTDQHRDTQTQRAREKEREPERNTETETETETETGRGRERGGEEGRRGGGEEGTGPESWSITSKIS